MSILCKSYPCFLTYGKTDTKLVIADTTHDECGTIRRGLIAVQSTNLAVSCVIVVGEQILNYNKPLVKATQ